MTNFTTILPSVINSENIVYFIILFSFVCTFILAPLIIKILYKFNFIMKTKLIPGVNDAYIQIHGGKVGTPTMGGVMIGIGVLFSLVLIQLVVKFNASNLMLYVIPFGLFFALGLVDDISSYGRKLSTRTALLVDSLYFKLLKLIALYGFAFFSVFYATDFLKITELPLYPTTFSLPINLFSVAILTFVSLYLLYGLEITDGADGLFTGNALITLFGMLALVASGAFIGEQIILTLIIGALLAYLYFNIKPARIFMGASGTYPVAITLILVALKTGLIIPFLIMGLFYWTVVTSSALQIFWMKVFKKRLFKIAPIHHWLQSRFEWEETKVVERSWWFSVIVTIIAIFIAFL
jgi:phospho-N-acetylmuramoyl-pentapeptide-transferase